MENWNLSRGAHILRLYGAGAIDHLDPVSAHEPQARQITRLFSRQLFSYFPSPDPCSWKAIAPVPDIARDVPSTYNAGLGASHLSYVVHLRPGVFWDTDPPRAVTAQDVVRGFKRLGNPVSRPRNLTYLTSTIRGFARYCEEYAASLSGYEVTPDRLAAFQNGHEIPGVFALDDESLVIELFRPALDAVNILASACVAPAPVEYDAYIPDSAEFRQNIRSTGPYRPVGYQRGTALVLERNPAWCPDSDPIRPAYADIIDIAVGAEPAEERIRTGAADLPWDVAAEASFIGCLPAGLDYLVFNFRRAAVQDRQLRRTVLTAVGTAGSIVPPGNDGHRANGLVPAAPRPVSFPSGLELTVAHLATSAVSARPYQSLADAGVKVRRVAVPAAEYDAFLREGNWDIAALSRFPDWFHDNGRVFLQPLLQSDSPDNFGRYASPRVDWLIGAALDSMIETGRARAAWRAAEQQALHDIAIIPFAYRSLAAPGPCGRRVSSAVPMPSICGLYDLSGVSLTS